MKKIFKLSILPIASFCAIAAPLTITSCSATSKKAEFCKKLRAQENPSGIKKTLKKASDASKTYDLYVHNDDVSSLIKDTYTQEEINNIKTNTKDVWDFSSKVVTNNQGTFIPAAKTSSSSGTSYEAIWVRDTVWNVLALKTQDGQAEKAMNAAKSIIKYFHTDKQMTRMKNVITNPEILNWASGAQNAVHIRFDCNSPTLDDVYVDGKEQNWLHKQNDALGLFINMLLEYYDFLNEEEKNDALDVLVTMVAYLNRAQYWNMVDSGSWEEIEKLACSSVGCVVSALEKLEDKLSTQSFKDSYKYKASSLELTDIVSTDEIHSMIKKGYVTVNASIDNGGESVSYEKTDKRYREADASMLHLIYPLNLKQLTIGRKLKILSIVETLNTNFGIKRYQNDNYQCNDFWFNDIKTDTEEESHKKREQLFVKGSEAAWFFDSWIACCYSTVYSDATQEQKVNIKDLIFYHLNKTLGSITSNKYYRGDGSSIDKPSLPESYNVIIDDTNSNKWYYVASPIDPLRWAQSSYYLMLNEVTQIL